MHLSLLFEQVNRAIRNLLPSLQHISTQSFPLSFTPLPLPFPLSQVTDDYIHSRSSDATTILYLLHIHRDIAKYTVKQTGAFIGHHTQRHRNNCFWSLFLCGAFNHIHSLTRWRLDCLTRCRSHLKLLSVPFSFSVSLRHHNSSNAIFTFYLQMSQSR